MSKALLAVSALTSLAKQTKAAVANSPVANLAIAALNAASAKNKVAQPTPVADSTALYDGVNDLTSIDIIVVVNGVQHKVFSL